MRTREIRIWQSVLVIAFGDMTFAARDTSDFRVRTCACVGFDVHVSTNKLLLALNALSGLLRHASRTQSTEYGGISWNANEYFKHDS